MIKPQFSQTEKKLIDLINRNSTFNFEGRAYTILESGKPTTEKGECKTDIFIKTDQGDFKISVKQSNADFLENKMSYIRAVQIFGSEADEILIDSIKSIDHSFNTHPLICFEKNGRTEEKTIVLGWKFELLNKVSGSKSGLLKLTNEQKLNVYSGHLLGADKRNAFINGEIVANSGVADYIIEVENTDSDDLQFYINKLQRIECFSNKSTIYFACKALNYRALKDKWDGDRPLAVYVNWNLNDKKELNGSIDYQNPLKVSGNEIGDNVRKILRVLDINKENFSELRKYYTGISHP